MEHALYTTMQLQAPGPTFFTLFPAQAVQHVLAVPSFFMLTSMSPVTPIDQSDARAAEAARGHFDRSSHGGKVRVVLGQAMDSIDEVRPVTDLYAIVAQSSMNPPHGRVVVRPVGSVLVSIALQT